MIRTHEVHEGFQRARDEPPSRVVEERARECRPPVFEDRLERPAVQVRREPVFEEVDDARAADRRIDGEVRGTAQTHE